MKYFFVFLLVVFIIGCSEEASFVSRESAIPKDKVKITTDMDLYPPVLQSNEFEEPVPLEVVNTAGAEDSPFIPADLDEIYFFFTPDVMVPVEEQVLDKVTGIYVSKRRGGVYQKPERIFLQDPGKLALDGCQFVSGNKMLFCSAREGYEGLGWFEAEYSDGWKFKGILEFPEEYGVGELHVYDNKVYYHSELDGGKGGLDIWMIEEKDGSYSSPVNIEAVNSEDSEGWPYISNDGQELWFNRWYEGTPASFRSKKIGGKWQAPELIVSSFAGEPTLDKEGNLYFVHHFYEFGEMREADIYVAKRK